MTNTNIKFLKKPENNPGTLTYNSYFENIEKVKRLSFSNVLTSQRMCSNSVTSVKNISKEDNHILYMEKTGKLEQMTIMKKTKTSSFIHQQPEL